MRTGKPSTFLSLASVLLLWTGVFSKNVPTTPQPADPSSAAQQRPLVAKRSSTSCGSAYDNYCLNDGECRFLLDMQEHHCTCRIGFSGNRCSKVELVVKPSGEEQIVVTVFCVALLIIGLAGLFYFCYKWCKKNRFAPQQKQLGYKGVQDV